MSGPPRPDPPSDDDALAATMAPPSAAPTRNPAADSAVDATVAAGPVTANRAQVDSFQDTVAARGGGVAAGVDELPLADPAQYIAEREVARGGMGRIVAAHDRHLGRPV